MTLVKMASDEEEDRKANIIMWVGISAGVLIFVGIVAFFVIAKKRSDAPFPKDCADGIEWKSNMWVCKSSSIQQPSSTEYAILQDQDIPSSTAILGDRVIPPVPTHAPPPPPSQPAKSPSPPSQPAKSPSVLERARNWFTRNPEGYSAMQDSPLPIEQMSINEKIDFFEPMLMGDNITDDQLAMYKNQLDPLMDKLKLEKYETNIKEEGARKNLLSEYLGDLYNAGEMLEFITNYETSCDNVDVGDCGVNRPWLHCKVDDRNQCVLSDMDPKLQHFVKSREDVRAGRTHDVYWNMPDYHKAWKLAMEEATS